MTNITFSCNKCDKKCNIVKLKEILCPECYKTLNKCNECKNTGDKPCCNCEKEEKQ